MHTPVLLNIGLAALLLALGNDTTHAADGGMIYDVADPPACQNNLGESVLFRQRDMDGNGFAAGMAIREPSGDPVVYRFNFDQSAPVFQRFIDRHECAHHQTGDIDRPHPPRNSPEHLMNESIADCVAILRVREESGGDDSELERTLEVLSDVMRQVGFPDISIDSRAANIRHCYRNYGSSEEFIRGVLRERGLL